MYKCQRRSQSGIMLPDGLELDGPLDEEQGNDPAKRRAGVTTSLAAKRRSEAKKRGRQKHFKNRPARVGASAASSRASNVNGDNNGGRGACLHSARPVH